MSDDRSDRARSTAVEQLKALGLSTYAARTFVALMSLREGTAQDVSEVADVPRTRVYDAADELVEHGLVDVKQSKPKRYWAVSTETVARHFEQQYTHRVSSLTEALEAVETPPRSAEQRGVWTVGGEEAVADRVVDFISGAEEEIVYMTVGDILTDGVTEALTAASERGVTIRLAEMSETTENRLERAVPDAELFESLWDWSDTPAGRLLMVDQQKTLVSVLAAESGQRSTDARNETAIWGTGEANSLVVVLRALFTWQLNGNRK